ncbi:hypothetical protein [Pseudoalteromonas porphyrae]|uniref:Uncharacterized protein n=1 Tax=Pseudoalteromonas porphyrae TaxID=187330 RepID=A0A0N0LYA7_9GAMM|nr:hypothetical protein [Pseudoalteromonas porphyrae]KPH61511.1 hypothetical protein ADS77_14195 [Pseudoalteromonas porphyrae]
MGDQSWGEYAAATLVKTSEGEITIKDGENPLDIRQWMALKMQPGILKRIKNGYISVKDTSVEEEAIKEFKCSLFEQLKTEGYSLAQKKCESSNYKDFEQALVKQWLSKEEDAMIESKALREVDSLGIAKSTKNIALFSAVIACVPIVINLVDMIT